ncbi:hypothetical protein [Candidatus Formimonas warabiya]|uniref:Uncharacterized protein n=1 Tax=Formimonas warabiya TaxID=1761012 RepID=A0A3G1KYG4_FORW1|nr:hypothetical protein [Candidatus Formimonas warabiya]ATW27450.1 hypothetical protein DCMF_24275 [Candidatus Formimonas warabiya]
MQLDHSILMVLLNLGLLLTFSWLGFQLMKGSVFCDKENIGPTQKLKISVGVSPLSFCTRHLVVRRMIKVDRDDDTAPYFAF